MLFRFDITDNQERGGALRPITDGRERAEKIGRLTEAALDGERTGYSAFDALALVVLETGIPRHYPQALIAGMTLDAEGFATADEADLLRYCWYVAGVVGVMMAIVMGVSPADRAPLVSGADRGLSFPVNNHAHE